MTDAQDTRDDRAPAIWALRFRWPAAIGFALVPVVFTAVASAVAQIMQASEAVSALVIAIGAAASAMVGLVIMRRSAPAARRYGLRAPTNAAAVWWFVPLPITIVVAAATQGFHVPWPAAASYAVLTIAVGVNEEVWFRGIVLAVLRGAGVRVAVIGSSALFGVLHLVNLAGGEDVSAAALQLVFAVLFGVVAAELVVLTGSLWPAIVWHAAWDFVNYLGGNATTGTALAGTGIACAVMLVYAIALWRRTMRTPA